MIMKRLLCLIMIMVISTVSFAAEITGITIAEDEGQGGSFSALYLINGAGFMPNGTDTHVTGPTGTMWRANLGDLPANITFDLQAEHDLDSLRVWNYNEAGYTDRGTGTMQIWVSLDGSSYTQVGSTYTLTQAPGDAATAYGENIDLSSAPNCRYIRFKVLTSLGSTYCAGLSEVRFYGTVVGNLPPTVDAGTTQAVQLPAGAVLDGTVTDDGKPDPPASLDLLWSQASGTGMTSFSPSATVEDPTASFTAWGDYELMLSADDSDAEANDVVLVKVFPADYNEIENVSVADYSSAYTTSRTPDNMLGTGLTRDGLLGYHSEDGGSTMWWAANNPVAPDYEWAIFDLNGRYNLDYIRLWNYNETFSGTPYTNRGTQDMDIYVSLDGSTYNLVDTIVLPEAPGDDSIDFSELLSADPGSTGVSDNVRYVKLVCKSNWGDSNVGLSEVIFSGLALNTAPTVELGERQWITLDLGGSVDIQFAPDITDDGNPSGTINALWEVVEGDANFVSFADDTDPCTVITMSATGDYVLQLNVDDGDTYLGSASDTVKVYVRPYGSNFTIGHWKMDGDATDISGFGNDANAIGAPQWQIDGQCEYESVLLDGTNDWFEAPNEPHFDLVDEVSISFWMKADLFARSYETILNKGTSYLIRRSGSTHSLQVYMNTVGSVTANSTVDNNKWHHIVATYDRTAVKLYIDGVLEGTDPVPARDIELNGFPVTIGTDGTYATREFNGLLQDVRIYEKGLSEAEVISLYLECGVGCEGGFMAGDTNLDCQVDFTDFADMAANWLECNNFDPGQCFN